MTPDSLGSDHYLMALSAPPEGAFLGYFAPRVDAREERLARNETIFREVNERIEQIASPDGRLDGHVYEFFCECSNLDCDFLLPLTVPDYDAVRAKPEQFLVAPGHELPEIETVVARHPHYQVVIKHGPAAEMAREEDPRS